MKRILTTLMTIMLMMGMAGSAETVYQEIPLPVYAQPTFYTCTDASGNTYDLFEIVKWQEDENHCVTAVTGRFERVVTDDDCETGEYANNGQTVTFPLAADFSAMMLNSMTDADDSRDRLAGVVHQRVSGWHSARKRRNRLCV